MSKLTALKKRVERILEKYPTARNDDRFLITAIYGEYVDLTMPFKEVMKDYTLPSFESIRRSRQKVQEEREDLRAETKVEEKRIELQQEYIEFAIGE